MAAMRQQLRGRRGASLVIEGAAAAASAGLNPQIGQRPASLSPDLQSAMPAQTLEAARGAIMLSYGIIPALMNPATTGPVIREAQRHLAQLILQPIALIVAEEATAKLGTRVTLDVVRPAQAFDQGGKARAFATMMSALADAKTAGLDAQAIKDAESFIDWAD